MSSESQKRVIVVLGMHRSGTSAITRALVAIGAQVGNSLLPEGADNPKGFWEDKDFVALNERLLTLLDASYDSMKLLPHGYEQRSELAAIKLEAVLILRQKLAQNDIFAIKDPRSCRLLAFWQQVFDHLDLRVDYVIAVRNPLSVARSLGSRNQFPQRKSLWLWLQHYVMAVCGTYGKPRVFVEYDQLLAHPENELQRLSSALQLQVDDGGAGVSDYVEHFLSGELRHATFTSKDLLLSPDVPEAIARAYELLLGAAAGELESSGREFADAWTELSNILQQQGPMLEFLQEYDQEVQGLKKSNGHLMELQNSGEREIERLNGQLILADRENQRQQQQIEQQQQQIEQEKQQIEQQQQRLHRLEQELEILYRSKSMRVTAPLRWASGMAQRGISRGRRLVGYILGNPRSLRNAVAHIRTHGLVSGLRRIREVSSLQAMPVMEDPMAPRFDLHGHVEVYVLTTRHCLFVAESIVRQLARIGVDCKILFEKPVGGFRKIPHFVICPQMFAELPELYVAFQMEQTVSSRWLTEQYQQVLERAFATFDYSLTNIGYFTGTGLSYRQMYYMPIAYLPDYHAVADGERSDKEYDVLFYGDLNNARRREFIDQIQRKYRVKLIGNLFGEALYRELRKAKVVINVHYYEGALLETTRLYECLSLGCLLVSESSVDIEQHEQLQDVIDFVEVGDTDGMLKRLDYWLQDDKRREERLARNHAILCSQPNWFEYYFQRFLLATDNIDFEKFYQLAGHNIEFAGNFVCLGLPESIERRADFDRDNTYGIEYFPGLRHALGWVGCGLSYKFIMRKAAEQRLPYILVCEDDVEFIEGWQTRLKIVLEYLVNHPDEWDVFSGFIADLHSDTRVTDLVECDGLEILHIDRMVSAVLNVYSANFYEAIMRWDETNHDVYTNAIDRYMESHEGIRVVTVHPFLVGHKEEHQSTLWGFHNSRYNNLIDKSTAALERKIEAYKDTKAVLGD